MKACPTSFEGTSGTTWNWWPPLVQLTKTNSQYKGGPLPAEVMTAFIRIRNIRASSPVVRLPCPDRQSAVVMDASSGTADTPGRVGAILTQMDQEGKFYAICYASRQLQEKEKIYLPYLLEMASALWAIRLFSNHLNH